MHKLHPHTPHSPLELPHPTGPPIVVPLFGLVQEETETVAKFREADDAHVTQRAFVRLQRLLLDVTSRIK
jgi:hypothetical protein